MIECNQGTFAFQDLDKRKVVADFQGGNVSADGGVLLLREIDARTGMIDRLATCFTDHRRLELIEHTLPELLRQRILGMSMGYEDLNDHDTLRRDPMMALGVVKPDPLGLDRSGEDGFIGPWPVWAQLRTSDRDASDGTLEALQRIVPIIRERFPAAGGGQGAGQSQGREPAFHRDQPARRPVRVATGEPQSLKDQNFSSPKTWRNLRLEDARDLHPRRSSPWTWYRSCEAL